LESIRQIALSTADPFALAEEMGRAQAREDKPAELALFVATRAALARDRGEPYDPAKDEATKTRAAALPEDVAKQAIAKGTQFVALNYRSHR